MFVHSTADTIGVVFQYNLDVSLSVKTAICLLILNEAPWFQYLVCCIEGNYEKSNGHSNIICEMSEPKKCSKLRQK